MNIFLPTLFLQPLVLVTLYLYMSGVFTNRRAFRFTFCYIVLACFALSFGITVRLSYPGYHLLASIVELVSEVLPES